jgi:hypothetical protein
MQEKNLDFVCFQETILQDFSDSCLRMIDPARAYLCDWIPAIGRSRGVLSEIKSERFDVGSREQGKYVLQHKVSDKKLEVKWTLLNVYGAAQGGHREEFLTEIASFCSKISDPYIISGDFNIIRFSSVKNKNFCPNKFSSIFNTFINIHELIEFFISGGSYTWFNN